MRKTAQTRAQNPQTYLPQIIADMHCDALTCARPLKGQVKPRELALGNFLCFSAFTKDNSAAAYAAARTLFIKTFSHGRYAAVKNYGDFLIALKQGKVPCALTCENIGFTGGDTQSVLNLRAEGVIMASLVWNYQNALAYPNVRADGRTERRGLKEKGREALAALDACGIIADISHLSDGGAAEILKNRKIPVAASHSCARAVCRNPRNLTDPQLKQIAGCGGVVGVNFYKKFLGGGGGYEQIAAHIKHIINVAGEETPAFGSDWDGVTNGEIAVYPRDMPQLLEFLHGEGISCGVLEKIACKNFLRVFKEVCK